MSSVCSEKRTMPSPVLELEKFKNWNHNLYVSPTYVRAKFRKKGAFFRLFFIAPIDRSRRVTAPNTFTFSNWRRYSGERTDFTLKIKNFDSIFFFKKNKISNFYEHFRADLVEIRVKTYLLAKLKG